LQLNAASADKSTRDRQQPNAVALLSTVGNVVLEKKGVRYLAGRIKLVGGP